MYRVSEATLQASVRPSSGLGFRRGAVMVQRILRDRMLLFSFCQKWVSSGQGYRTKGIRRQGTGYSARNSYLSTLCPVVMRAYLCTF